MKLLIVGISIAYWSLFIVTGFSLVVVFLYLKKKILQTKEKQKELMKKIAELEKRIVVQAARPKCDKRSGADLDKEKIEKAINAKLGMSSWEILKLMVSNPSISNKEIAKQVSLSVEGVSSSLRRMYASFEVKASSNKRIALVMRALLLSEKPLDKEPA